jgi:hypothetical protein
MIPKFRRLQERDYISAKEWNTLVDLVKGLYRSTATDGIIDSTGFHPRKKPFTIPAATKVYRISLVDAEEEDGVYSCILQKWDSEQVDYVPTVEEPAESDYVKCKIVTEAEGHGYEEDWLLVSIGEPDDNNITPAIAAPEKIIYKAYCKTDAGAGSSIVCYLNEDKTEENNPAEITVNCEICNGSNLNSAVPRLADGDMLFVTRIGDSWHAMSPFQASEDCST